jgi:hypothetical protein
MSLLDNGLSSTNSMATNRPIGFAGLQSKSNVQALGQYTFLKGGPGLLRGNTKDPATNKIVTSMSGNMKNKMERVKSASIQNKRQLRFNEKNRGSPLPQVVGGQFAADYHQAVAGHNYLTKNYIILGVCGAFIILFLLRP